LCRIQDKHHSLNSTGAVSSQHPRSKYYEEVTRKLPWWWNSPQSGNDAHRSHRPKDANQRRRQLHPTYTRSSSNLEDGEQWHRPSQIADFAPGVPPIMYYLLIFIVAPNLVGMDEVVWLFRALNIYR